jgi:hypothetical protein
MSEDEDRARQREMSDLRWEIHKLGNQKAAVQERLSLALPEAVGRLQEQLGVLENEMMLAAARLTYLDKLEISAESRSENDEEWLKLKPKKPKLKR